jgi:hypothetical protein
MTKKIKGVHKAFGRGGRAQVIEITVKSIRKPARTTAPNMRRSEVRIGT